MKTIAIIGTFDTKGTEFELIKKLVREQGLQPDSSLSPSHMQRRPLRRQRHARQRGTPAGNHVSRHAV